MTDRKKPKLREWFWILFRGAAGWEPILQKFKTADEVETARTAHLNGPRMISVEVREVRRKGKRK
jgi:hypothetical protein